MILYHYTDQEGLRGILKTMQLHASTSQKNRADVRYGDGQYLSDIPPGSKTASQLSRAFLNLPFHGKRFTHFVAIEVEGMPLIHGREGVFVVPNHEPLDLTGRIVDSGVSFAGHDEGTRTR